MSDLIDKAAFEQALLRQRMDAFIQKVFYTVVPGETFNMNWHIRTIAWHLEEVARGNIKRLIINLPPRYLKSICASVAFPAWVLGRDPTSKIICASYSHDLAAKHAFDCRSVMEAAWYRKAFPQTRFHSRKNTSHETVTTKMGFRLATSVDGTLTGRGGNFIIIDDPLDPQKAYAQGARDHVNEWYDTKLYSRLDNKSLDRIVIVMQRVHVDDLVGHALGKDDWTVLDIPAIAEKEQFYPFGREIHHRFQRLCGSVIDKIREPRQILDSTKIRIGSFNFSAQYQQQPVYKGGNFVDIDWFRTYDSIAAASPFEQIIQSWDTAAKADSEHDYSACSTWGIKGRDSYLLNSLRVRLLYPHLKQRILSEAAKWNADGVFIEDAGSGISLIQDFQNEGSLWPLHGKPKGDKVMRMMAQTAQMEAGRVWIPKEANWLKDWKLEIMAFPQGKHDDQVDSMSQFLGYRSKILGLMSQNPQFGMHKNTLGKGT